MQEYDILIELVEILSSIDTSLEGIKWNSTHMRDSEGNIIEY